MRTTNVDALAVLNGVEPVLVLLVAMMLEVPYYVCSAPMNIEYDGDDYIGVGQLGTVETIEDVAGDYKPLRLTLNGVVADLLALAIDEEVRGKRVTIRLGVLHPETYVVLDAPVLWGGNLEQMVVGMGGGKAAISVTAEHRGALFARPRPLRYTDGDQQKLYPGDTSLRFITDQANHEDVFPAAAYFKV